MIQTFHPLDPSTADELQQAAYGATTACPTPAGTRSRPASLAVPKRVGLQWDS
jgi:hypothetical protein